MSYNGSGTFNRTTSGTPYVSGSTISSTVVNNEMTDIATGLSTAICKDGQTTITANLPMASFRHTGVGNSAARTDYASAADVQDNTLIYLTAVAGTNTITATGANGLAAYVTGQRFHFIAANTNTGATTININSIGAKSITKNGTTALVAGEIAANSIITIVYDGTRFQIQTYQTYAAAADSGFTRASPNYNKRTSDIGSFNSMTADGLAHGVVAPTNAVYVDVTVAFTVKATGTSGLKSIACYATDSGGTNVFDEIGAAYYDTVGVTNGTTIAQSFIHVRFPVISGSWYYLVSGSSGSTATYIIYGYGV